MLPDVPREAIRAATKRLYQGLDVGTYIEYERIAKQALDGAWPYLYAAALRHVAQRLRIQYSGDLVVSAVSRILQSWADRAEAEAEASTEATP